MAELWLVCEGEPQSVDVAILKLVFANILTAEIIVESACGSSPHVVATFLEQHRGGLAAYLNDRDYKPRAQAEAAFTDGRPGFYWRRHSIENYLLQPVIIVRALTRLRQRLEQQRRHNLPNWMEALPTKPEHVADMLRACAGLRSAEEACRLATERLWTELPSSVGQVQRRWPPSPGGDSGSASAWRDALCQEVARVREAACRTADAPHFQVIAVGSRFDAAYAEVSANAYVANLEFLYDFHGRDLLKAFHQKLIANRVRLSYEYLCNDLISAVIDEYRENRTVYGSDDFKDLANGVRSLAHLSALT